MAQLIFSDLHGCNQTFQTLLDKTGVTTDDEMYILGDYVDRGPDSKGVIDTIWRMQAADYKITCLAGNHELITIDAYDAATIRGEKNNGDYTLLHSFGVETMADVPAAYIDWMRALPLVLEIPGAILVHAGLDFSEPDPLMPDINQAWIRNWHHSINYNWLGDRIIIHGHTPIGGPAIKDMLEYMDEYRVLNIDAGCAFRHRPGILGMLCCFNLTERRLIFQENVDGSI